jgi:hypothetical protein
MNHVEETCCSWPSVLFLIFQIFVSGFFLQVLLKFGCPYYMKPTVV